MNQKFKMLLITNVLFYVFVLFHRFIEIKYEDDYVIQVLFYIALFLSSNLIEQFYKLRERKLMKIAVFDFSVRVITLVVHFSYLALNLDILIINIITISLFILNIIMEIIIFNIGKSINIVKEVSQGEISKFIERIHSNTLEVMYRGKALNEKIEKANMESGISGKSITMSVVIIGVPFVLGLVYKNSNKFVIIPILISMLLIYEFLKLTRKLIDLSNIKNKNRRFIIDSLCFIVGYLILCISQTFLKEKLGYFYITSLMVGILFWVPYIITRNKCSNGIREAYKEYKLIEK